MKKYLVIFLLTFVIAVGFSGAVSAQPIGNGIGFVPSTIVIAPNIVIGTIINSPGSIIAGGNVASVTGGDTMNAVGSSIFKTTNNFGGWYSGNTVIP